MRKSTPAGGCVPRGDRVGSDIRNDIPRCESWPVKVSSHEIVNPITEDAHTQAARRCSYADHTTAPKKVLQGESMLWKSDGCSLP